MTDLAAHQSVGDAEVESHARAAAAARAVARSGGPGWLLLALFAAGATVLADHAGVGHGSIGATFAVLAALYAVAGLVEFEVGPVNTDCSVASLAAMLVTLPPALIPWCVAVGAALGAGGRARRAGVAARLAVASGGRAGLAAGARARRRARCRCRRSSVWQDAPAIAAALGAYVVADLVISIIFERLAYGKPLALPSLADAWVYAVDLLLAPVGVAMAIVGRRATCGRWAWSSCRSRCCCASSPTSAGTRIDQALELSQAYRGTAMLLGDVVETDDAYTGSHSRDVVELAVEVGRRAWASMATRCATWSSARCCTTSARSPCRRRSSTSPAS